MEAEEEEDDPGAAQNLLNNIIALVNPPPADGEEEEEESGSSSSSEEGEEEEKGESEGASTQMGSAGSTEEGGEGPSTRPSAPSKRRRSREVTFNQDLPTTHSYLGQDLEDVGGGQAVLESEAVLENVPLYPIPGVILMPQQLLPVQSLHPRVVSMFEKVIQHRNLFLVVVMRHGRSLGEIQELANIGTLAQVVAFKEETQGDMTELKVRAVGRQRAELLETRRGIDGSLMGKVRVMPEVILSDSLKAPSPPSFARYRLAPPGKRLMKTGSISKYGKYCSAPLTAWPWFVYKQYDIEYVVGEVVRELSEWYERGRLEKLMGDRVQFSYWIAQNLPIDDDTKLQLLGTESAIQRLRYELSLIRNCLSLCCRNCGEEIGSKRSIFSMSLDGPLSAYVNPHGHIHETVTLAEAKGVKAITRPDERNSWFPGYAWSILECKQCSAHMGWKFTVAGGGKGLKPSKFYGICRASLVPKMAEMRAGDESEDSPLYALHA